MLLERYLKLTSVTATPLRTFAFTDVLPFDFPLNQASKSLPFELSSLGDSLLTLHALSDTPDYAEHLSPALDLLAAWVAEALAAWSQATGTRHFAETLSLGEPLAVMHRLLTSEETPATKAVLGLNAQEEIRKMSEDGVMEELHRFVKEVAKDVRPSSQDGGPGMVESNVSNSESDRKEYYANVAKAYHKLDQIVSKFEKWDFFKFQGRSIKEY